MLPDADFEGAVTVKATLVFSLALESLNGCCAGEMLQPVGACNRSSPSTAARAAVTSTSTDLRAPGVNSATLEPKCNATGETTARCRGLPESFVETGSSATTRVCPPTSKTNSIGNAGG